MPRPSDRLEGDLAALATLSPAQLREHWTRVTGRTVPRISPAMLRLALGWEMQARVFGGHSRRTIQRLDQLASAKSTTRPVQPGMRLVREWNGTLHVVMIGEDQVIRWNDRDWRSLSEVARAITGTRWSGPAFFGLRQKQSAA